ncbi:MAG: orotidine 5'-phosphate decarboxylase, partial [Bdellovibrionales bacterium]|nr:orotidine 5'-phosphate decarboxylase [Bdellovibrionales bacterium]
DIAEAGLRSIVCAPHEVKAIKSKHPNFYAVTPGIRPTGDSQDDQQRVATPIEARANGADAIVVGRPIYQADEPHKVVESILKELS